jgi:hypothetical protein
MPLAPRPPQTFVIVAGLLMTAAAIWYANETGASIRGLLGFPSPSVDGVVAIGAALHALTARWIHWLRAALLLPVATYVWNAARHPERRQGRGAGASALCLALVAQSFLVEGWLAAGLVAYAAAAIIYLARPLDRRAGEQPPPADSWRWRESLTTILLFSSFLAAAVYGLDLLPIPVDAPAGEDRARVAAKRPRISHNSERACRRSVRVQRMSCAQRTPFVWIIDRAEEHAPALTNLTHTFDCESSTNGPYRIYTVRNPKPGTCPDAT